MDPQDAVPHVALNQSLNQEAGKPRHSAVNGRRRGVKPARDERVPELYVSNHVSRLKPPMLRTFARDGRACEPSTS